MHIILGISDNTRIKTQERPIVGIEDEPIAELMKLGWVFVFPVCNSEIPNKLSPKTSKHDYENLCSLDCLGIENNHVKSDDYVYEKFRKQLGRSSDVHYKTSLIWKGNHRPLNDNKSGSIGRLTNLLGNLKGTKRLEVYNSIFQEQRENEIIERVEVVESFYLRHKPVTETLKQLK